MFENKKMIEFNSERIKDVNGNITFFVKNDKDRKIVNKKLPFSDLYPKVIIDGRIYETKNVECMSISYVPKGNIIGIEVK